MSLYPFISLFSSTLIFSSLLALSSSHWLIVWASLELNMISFIPLITISTWSSETEASVNYFLFQALGSSLLLLSAFTPLLQFFLSFAIIINLGMAPFHFWFPSVINSITWPLCFTLSTWQNVAPLAILLSSTSSSALFLFLASFNAIIGGLGGLNQSQIRPLLAYSSIGHIGWILAISLYSPWISSIYFSFYIAHSLILFSYLWLFNIFTINHISSSANTHPLIIFILTLILLSLGGLPPFAGFIPNWLGISSFSTPFIPSLLILGSLINIYYYLNITLGSLLSKPNNIIPSLSFPLMLPIFLTISISLITIII